ncbi:hypothetical protein B0T24DRAFT_611570 [Lasiosphaeria ovina]|uniref:Secreted peptide n=1 Tax=Lasiosphaeria ovina TaxID=92902 RepID=A0AAE0KMV3_9PEZI|nr:hypothetical protein B0T24DRAFT_611570 [Lasiosphaeria ovina]
MPFFPLFLLSLPLPLHALISVLAVVFLSSTSFLTLLYSCNRTPPKQSSVDVIDAAHAAVLGFLSFSFLRGFWRGVGT